MGTKVLTEEVESDPIASDHAADWHTGFSRVELEVFFLFLSIFYYLCFGHNQDSINSKIPIQVILETSHMSIADILIFF